MVPETAQQPDRRVGAEPGSGHHDGAGRLVVQALRSWQQLQDDRADLVGQPVRRLDGTGWQEGRRPFLDGRPHRRVQLRGVLKAGRGQQVDAGAYGLVRVAPGDQGGEDLGALAGAALRDGHADHVLPLGVRGILDQQADVPLLDEAAGAQVVLEGAVDELDGAGGGFAQQAAAEQQVPQDRGGVALGGGGGHGGQRVGEQAFGV